MMIRREVLEQVGLLDEAFFLDYEDVDLCCRIKQAGWKICLLHTVPVIHFVGSSKKNNYSVVFHERYRSMFTYYTKHKSRRTVAILRAAVTLHSCLAIIASFVPIGRHRERRPAYLKLIRQRYRF